LFRKPKTKKTKNNGNNVGREEKEVTVGFFGHGQKFLVDFHNEKTQGSFQREAQDIRSENCLYVVCK